MRAQRRQKIRARGNHIHIARDRLDDDGGDFAVERRERRRRRLRVVVRQNQRVARRPRRHPGRRRRAERERARSGGDQKRIGVAVIAAREFNQQIAVGESARDADRRHCRFGAGSHGARHFDFRPPSGDCFGEFDFDRGRAAEAQAARERRFDGAQDLCARVADNRRPPRIDEIDKRAPVGIDQPRAVAASDKKRLAADARERPRRRINAARNPLLRARKKRPRCFAAHFFRLYSKLSICAANARAAASISGALKIAPHTATACAPQSTTAPAFPASMPPMATILPPPAARRSFAARRKIDKEQRAAAGLVGDEYNAPNAQ